MGVKHLRDSFNAAAAGKASAYQAFLAYEMRGGEQVQVVRFVGQFADGSPMDMTQDLDSGIDPVLAAALTASDIPVPVPQAKPEPSAPVVVAPAPTPEPPVINVTCYCTCQPAPTSVSDPGPTPEPTPDPAPVIAAPAPADPLAVPVDSAPPKEAVP